MIFESTVKLGIPIKGARGQQIGHGMAIDGNGVWPCLRPSFGAPQSRCCTRGSSFCCAEFGHIQFSELGVIHARPLQDFILVEALVEPILHWHLALLGNLCRLLFVRERQLRDQKILGCREALDALSSFLANLVLLFG